MKANVGQDIESVCSGCGTSWHVVVAMIDANVMKVECKQCHSVHRHRGAKPATPARSRAGSGAKKARAVAALVEPRLDRPVQPYATSGRFEPGDRLDHATFGRGIVQRLAGPGRIEVLFGEELKTLAQAKPSGLRS
jgi:hypothetical protein